MASKVYFSDLRVPAGKSLLVKLKELLLAAGMGEIDFAHKYAAIKIHFGEPGNVSYIRPNYAKVVADLVTELGGRPFLTDCNTLYVGRRKNALDHISSAYENGFSPFSTGCHVLIGDGLKGTDEVRLPIPGGELLEEARIGRAIMDADVFISLNHFKGHECTGFGGALKNIGMGCGSRAGKMAMHSSGKAAADPGVCINCGICAAVCAHDAQEFDTGVCIIDPEKCVGCGMCLGVCPVDAIYAPEDSANDLLNMKIAEYTKAVLHNRPNFHINLVMNVSPFCDCHDYNDAPIVPDLGLFASFDPVALDIACADAVNAQKPVLNSFLGEAAHTNGDHFTDMFPDTSWRIGLAHAEKLGIGTMDYTLVKV